MHDDGQGRTRLDLEHRPGSNPTHIRQIHVGPVKIERVGHADHRVAGAVTGKPAGLMQSVGSGIVCAQSWFRHRNLKANQKKDCILAIPVVSKDQ